VGSILVLNSHAPQSLVAIRSFGARGLAVTAGSSKSFSIGQLSRHAHRSFRYPDPTSRTDAFLDALQEELTDHSYDMLLPMNESTVDIVVNHRHRFEDETTIPFPKYETLRLGLNKRRTVEAAREAGVPQPKTLFSTETTVDEAEAALGYPLVVKAEHGSGREGVSVCHSRDELDAATTDPTAPTGPVLFQEFIPNGGERGVYTLYDGSSTMVGLTVQHRLRSLPPSGGVSTYRETVADPQLVELTDQFLTALDWQGLAMAEFRIDARTGEPQLIELNPRFWGSLALSTFAGVDFPYLLYRLARGEHVEPNLEYDVGVRARNLSKDTFQLLHREDRLTALQEFVTPSTQPATFDILSVDDPLPIVGEFLYRFHSIATKSIPPTPSTDTVADPFKNK
jgi:predicted ATP-grasp superfamily ATP-dependent carboligase